MEREDWEENQVIMLGSCRMGAHCRALVSTYLLKWVMEDQGQAILPSSDSCRVRNGHFPAMSREGVIWWRRRWLAAAPGGSGTPWAGRSPSPGNHSWGDRRVTFP